MLPFALIGTVAVLAKETSVLLYGPCLLVALWALVVKNRDFSGAGFMVLAAVVSALLAVALLVYSTGGVTVPLQIFRKTRVRIRRTRMRWVINRVPVTLVVGVEASNPLTFTLAVLGLGIVIVRDRRARSETALLAWMTIGFLAIFMLMPLCLTCAMQPQLTRRCACSQAWRSGSCFLWPAGNCRRTPATERSR